MGDMLSIRLQWTLIAAVNEAGAVCSATSRWWRHQLVSISAEVYVDLILLHACRAETTGPTAEGTSIGSRPVGMVIRRKLTAQAFSDASYNGLGGWCPNLSFFWLLLASDLVSVGLT
jgi:hypothetical protein